MNIRSRKTTLQQILRNVNLKLSNYYGLRSPCREVIEGMVWTLGSSTETTRRSSSHAKISYISEYQAMQIQLIMVKSDIATPGNNFPLKKMLKRWPYILIRAENESKKWVVHIKSIWLTISLGWCHDYTWSCHHVTFIIWATCNWIKSP